MIQRNRRDGKHGIDNDNKIFEPNSELNLNSAHKKWFHEQTMAKQRGKPQYDLKEKKKINSDQKK